MEIIVTENNLNKSYVAFMSGTEDKPLVNETTVTELAKWLRKDKAAKHLSERNGQLVISFHGANGAPTKELEICYNASDHEAIRQEIEAAITN
ncbi:hypothetical protein A2482_03085 [Candidatus Falkowbacteria bacterium RIFOXYC2_FULL_48_21]|uniref:Uncharacterized protein n=1 Tax=Candidatus Falkowbacteria bacterium RIFOXYC2_FULL_48_21 TaxID=1798005 RepID=A0A1F5T7V2_9BACT|nr:MAG: hypothetical protein A2482_03085 [Candidatus Falkowbacteria bacterium RIFOXYC2_FULL_48_21]